MLRKILKLFSENRSGVKFTKEDIKKIESVGKLHYTLWQRVNILHQDIFKVLEEIYFLTGKDLMSSADIIFKQREEMYEVKDGWITELENPKKGLGVFIMTEGKLGYYYIKGVSGNESYIELCGTKEKE
jgi:hypothetical protein